MIKNKTFLYSVAFLAMTIPSQGRFVYGLVLVLELLLLEAVGTLFKLLASKLKFNDIASYFVMMFVISFTILFRQIFAILYSEIILTMGFIIYFPAVSTILFYTVFEAEQTTLGNALKTNLLKILKFSFPILCFFLFRDIAGYGTITFFGSNHQLYEKLIFNPQKIGALSFFASIPGALILSASLIYLLILAKNQIMAHAAIQNEQNAPAHNATAQTAPSQGETK